MKVNAARPKIVSIVIATLISGLLVSIPVPANAAACSPASTTTSGGETILTFTTVGACTWTPPTNFSNFEVLVVGAGGGGGSSIGGGGGGGQVVYQGNVTISSAATITVGVGGIGGVGSYGDAQNHGKTGSSSSITNGSVSVVSLGGSGGSGRYSATNLNTDGTKISTGYTGGGGTYPNGTTNIAVAGTGGAGFIGGDGAGSGGGGGGGAGGPGVSRDAASNASSGGVGVSNSITGTATYYGGGGGASWYSGKTNWTGVGGLGGGGNGANGTGAGISGTANTGGGGGGGYDGATSATAANGGSGIVIIRYLPAGSSMLAFNANGGTGTKSGIVATNGTPITNLPDGTGFTNDGFNFVSWNTAANGSGTPYLAGSSITINAATTLYAQWTRNPIPSCAAGVGLGGPGTSNYLTTKAGNGCVGISYTVSGVTTVATFNYTGSDQSWTVPTGVTSARFYLIGAGGGGGIQAGGGGGYATGEYSSLTPGQVLTVIVGQGGGGVASTTRPGVSGYPGQYTPTTYGGGGRGGSFGNASANWFASGGGRSAIRLPSALTDLVTAAGGGGGAYGQCGFGGGGTTGSPGTTSGNSGTGGTQTAGGTGGNSGNGYPGTAGVAYQGGDSKDEGGGGGGGFYGGGGGGDNAGGPGGSSYVALLTSGFTNSGGNCGAAAVTTGLVYVVTYDANNATSGTSPSNSTTPIAGGTLTLATNSGTLARTNYTFNGWNTAANGSGTSYAVGATTFSPSSDTTLYAQWNSTITYNGNGYTSLIGTVPTAITAKGSTNNTLAAPTTLLKTNFIFDGWNTLADGTGTSYASGLTTYVSTGSRTLYAQWKAAITFSGNTNSGGTAPAIVNAITATIVLPTNSGSLVKTGYSFSAWNTAADGTGTTYATGATYTITGPATLYAVWTPSNAGLTPSFNTDTNSPIGVLGGASYVINTVYTNNTNDLVLSQYAEKVQIIAIATAGTVAITTTTNLTLPKGYQSALNTAAASISFIGNLADVNAALATLKYTAPATATNATVKVYAAYAGFNGDYRYNPANDHSYVTPVTIAGVSQSLTWAETFAKSTANSNCGVTFNNMCGYLVTIKDAAENTFVVGANINTVTIWTGMWAGYTNNASAAYTTTDCQTACTFKNVPNAPTGEANTTITYTNWNGGEPNGGNIPYSVIEMANTGVWNDNRPVTATQLGMFEFGGKGEVPTFAALTRTITFGGLAATGTPTLATASDTGISSTDKITKDNTPDINIGGLTSGATVTLTATPASGTAVTCTFTATSTTGTCTFPTMADGTYSIVATQTLGGATTAASTALANVKIDATRPTVNLSSLQIVSGGNRTATPGVPAVTNQIFVNFSEVVYGLLISEITKNSESTGWAITTAAFSTSALATQQFNVTNATGAGGTAGTLKLSVQDGVVTDEAGNTNTATTSDFIINTLIELTLSNGYQQSPILADVVGGSGATIAQTVAGQAITMPGQLTLTRVGHTFAGWSLVTTNGSGAVVGATYTPTVPVILFSSWTPNVYVVTYDANGGNGAPATASQSFNYRGTALSPSARGTLTKTGYTFGGWSTAAIAAGTIYSNSTDAIASTTTTYTPTASIILYAKWTANTYAVTFDANNGTGTQIANMSIVAGTAKALTTNTYTRTGYTFGGWNTAANGIGGTAYANSASVTLFGNATIYAQWVPVKPGVPTVAISGSAGNTQITVAVTAATLGATSGPPSSFTVTSSPGGLTCTITSPATTCTFTGLTNGQAYTFTAVGVNTTGSSASSSASSSATPAPYLVTYSLNSGTLTPATANYNLGTPLTLPLPTRTGYTFGGWYAEVGLTTLVGNDGASYSPTAATTLYAKWTGVVYTITYNGNGSDSGTVLSAATFTFGNTYSIGDKGTMSKSGYAFAGWTTAASGAGTVYANAGNSIVGSTATYGVAANLNLYAKWTALVYTITYNANGATGSPSRATDSFTFGTTPITLPDKTGMTFGGYTFGGWSESSAGAAVINPYSPTQTRTLYALWTGVQYSISYNVNGGTGSIADATYTTGATGITLNDGSTLSRTGYTFGGWKNLAGTTVSGSPFVVSDNLTVYAIWTPKTITVTYDKGIASATPASFPTSPANATFGSNYVLGTSSDTATVSAGGNFAFAGWKIGNITYKAGDSYRISVDAPVTVTAQWIQVFEVTYNSNGGTFASGDSVNDSQCPSALCLDTQTIALNLAPTRTGFTFAGWVSQSGTNYAAAASTNVAATNYIFYATWTANSYTITFAAGTGANGSASAITDSHGAIVQLAASTGYSLAGSVFTGWLIGATTYPAGAFYTMGTDATPITATAQYANNTFKVFYNTNGATAGVTPAATAAVQGANITLDGATGFSRPGFTFEGWSDGTAVRAAGYATTMGSTNSTVIAQWKIAIPLVPTISSVTGSDGGATITLAANGSGGAPSSYLVTASPGGATCTVNAPQTSCSISPLTNGTAYTFSATATNSTGTSAPASFATAVTPAGKPDAPTGVNAVAGNASAAVSFTAPTITGGPAIVSYTVTASPDGATCTVNAPATSCVVSGLTNGTAYTFTVTANNGLFTSSASTASSSVVPATVPGAPTSVGAASTTSGSATITFTAPTSNGGSAITGYTVTSSPTGATCVVGANATTYTCTGLTNGTAYTYSVIAVNAIGNSTSATSSSLTTQGAASAPTTISATAGDGGATVTFSGAVANGSTITGYTVKAYDSTGNEVSGISCTVTTAATNGSCVVTGLTNGSGYTFKAVTNSTANSTAVSSAVSIPTSSVTPAKAPDAPSGLEVTAGTGKVTVAWTEPSSNGSTILSYTVQAYDAAGNAVAGATCTVNSPALTCDVSTNLVAGSNYTFKVTATSAAGTSAASSASPSAAVNAVPSAPLAVTAAAGNASATVSWNPPANSNGSAVTGYTATAYTAGNIASGTCTAIAPETTCLISGLANGVPYTFKVTATNGIGTSGASDPSAAATPSTIPNAPTNVVAAMGDASATISFIAPTNNGGSNVLSYTVTSNPGNFTCTVNAPATSCNVTELTNGTPYTFTVSATNKNGNSSASTVSTAGTPVLSSAPILVNPGQPTGNPYVGSPLTSNVTFSGSPTPTVTYQWKVCTDPLDLGTCTNISGATSASFTPTLSELGKYIVVDATANNGIGNPLTETSNPTLVIKPEIAFSAPSPVPGATTGTAYVLSMAATGGVGTFAYTVTNGTLPSGVSLDPATGQISGTPTTAGTFTFTVRVTDSNGVYKDVVVTIVVAAAAAPAPTTPTTPTTPTEPQPVVPTCDSNCQSARDAAATKAAADKSAADAIAKAAAEKATADAAVATKVASDTAATTASTKATADAAAAVAAAKAAVDKAAAAAVAQAAADAAAKAAAAQAKAASDAQAAAAKAAADAAAALRNSTTTAAAKAAATKSANTAAVAAATAVKAAATAAQQAAKAKTTAANATKQVEIAINSLNSKTASSQASAQANEIAAAAKAAANEAAASAVTKAAEAKAKATTAQKAASDTAARIATEQKQAADAAALAKIATEAAAKATAVEIAATEAARVANEALVKILNEKAALAEQAVKATTETARAEINKKIEEVTVKAEEAQKVAETAATKADAAEAAQEEAVETAEDATKEAQIQAAEAVEVKAESVTKTAEATKAVAAATVAAKVATAAKAAAAKVPATAKIVSKPSTSTSKNSAKATVTGLKPGQKVKVTVNVKPRP